MTKKNPDQDKWYFLWYITEEFQKKPIDEILKYAIQYYKKTKATIVSIELNKKNYSKYCLIDSIEIKESKDVSYNHVLLEFKFL